MVVIYGHIGGHIGDHIGGHIGNHISGHIDGDHICSVCRVANFQSPKLYYKLSISHTRTQQHIYS